MSVLTEFTNTIGETITFYSYKGGNGRTMALSNVATLLAQQNPKDKILVIDWDLEAPGLHRFFFQDSLFSTSTNEERDKLYKKVEEKPGLIDLFITLRNMVDEYRMLNENNLIGDVSVTKILDNLKLDDFILSTSFNNLHIMKAGCFDKHYPDKVNTFNWEELYNKAPSLIRLFSAKLTKNYKYVLIDSRTGFTDISGICTMLMPQKLVLVFTPNRQSYTGIKDLIIKATTYRRKSNDFRPLLVFPLPSRIEFSRDDLRAYWRYGNNEKRITGYQNMFQDIFTDVYGLDECNLTEYFEQVQIQQSPNYAYGEEIAIISEKTKDSFSLSKSYEIFTQWLVDSLAPWESKKSDEASNIDITAAIDFYNIGLEFENKGQHEKALSYYNRSLAIYEKLEDEEELGRIHNKIGILLKNMEKFDDALNHLKKAFEIHTHMKDNKNRASDCLNIGFIYEQKSDYNKALEFYDEALKFYPEFPEALDAKRLLRWKIPSKKNRIFISYSSEDVEAANQLFHDLKEFDDANDSDLELFLDNETILAGKDWRGIIKKDVGNSQYIIVLLSKNSIKKNKENRDIQEIVKDINKEYPDSHFNIIPIRLDDCQISNSILQETNIIDLFPDWREGFQKLLKAIGMEAKSKKLSEEHWKNLLIAIDQKNCIPFIGESALEFFKQIDGEESFLTNQEIAKDWAEKYNYPLSVPYQLPEIAQFLAIQEGNERLPKEILSNILRNLPIPDFSSVKYNKSPYVVLAQLDLPIYITTNYDLLLEEALRSQGKEPVSEICKWNDQLIKYTRMGIIPSSFDKKSRYKPTPSKPLVFHLHGSIEFPESMVLIEKDYNDFVTNTNKIEIENDVIPSLLRIQLANSLLLFLGYNLDDIYFRSIFNGFLNFLGNVRRKSNNIVVMENIPIDDKNSKEKILKYFKFYTRNIFDVDIYWGSLQEFLNELQTLWKTFKNKGSKTSF